MLHKAHTKSKQNETTKLDINALLLSIWYHMLPLSLTLSNFVYLETLNGANFRKSFSIILMQWLKWVELAHFRPAFT